MGHSQPPTPVQVDNSTALGIATGTVKQRKSKAMDMRFYWIRDRKNQKQFNIYWKPGSTNKGDYFTKHLPPTHHWTVRPSYLHVTNYGKRSTLQGCVNLKLSANYPVHPGAPTKSSTHAYTQNCARICAKQRTITFYLCWPLTQALRDKLIPNNDSEIQSHKIDKIAEEN